MSLSTVVFDVGNVLVEWNPLLAFAPELGSETDAQAFLQRIGFADLNLRADAGETFADLADEIFDDEDRALFLRYPDLYARTIQQPIEGSFALIDRLKARGHAVHAITNWSAETWPIGVSVHPRLASAFGVTLVSGEVGILKPVQAIFDLMCTRAGVSPEGCLFIDDSPKNVAGAQAAGWAGHLFTTPEALEAVLIEEGLL